MNWLKKTFLVMIAFFAIIIPAQAQSSLYIQGDKQTPIYVKVEGQMMPRQGLNYCIIPGLEAGLAHFEILFQGNQYPIQKYLIKIPENGVRGLLLTKVDDNNFALFDLQTQGYIYNNNTSDEAFLQFNPINNNNIASNSQTPSNLNNQNSDNEYKQQKEPTVTKSKNIEPEIAKESTKTNRFMDNINLSESKTREKQSSNDKSILVEEKLFKSNDDGIVKDKNENSNVTATESTPSTIPNTDCSNPMNESAFESFLGVYSAHSDDEAKLKYVKRNFEKRCFSSEQSGILANLVNGQSTRYELLQTLYPRVSDQDNFGKLEKLFSTDFLKKRFRDLVK